MKPATIVKIILNRQSRTSGWLADKLGTSNATMWDRLNRKKNDNMSVKVLEEMLRQLDYEIIVQPKALGRRPEGCFLLDMKDGDTK